MIYGEIIMQFTTLGDIEIPFSIYSDCSEILYFIVSKKIMDAKSSTEFELLDVTVKMHF